ncbi:transposable element Tcb2 transposase [Trichonephila clavipes]|nr:transposable element Tcb2 transposase [Trichonephila clavipes]
MKAHGYRTFGIAVLITGAALDAIPHRRLRLEWCHVRGNRTIAEWNQVVFSDKSTFNLSIDNNRVLVRRPRVERFNPAFALQRHTTPTAGMMVGDYLANNTRSPLVLIRGTTHMTSCHHMCCHSCNGSQEPVFNMTMLGLTRQVCIRTVTTLPWPARSPDLSPIEHI